MWFVYIVRCTDNTLYTGIAKDVGRRVKEHNSNDRLGASYTRARRPVALGHSEAMKTRSAAARREYEIKQMSRQGKEKRLRQSKEPKRQRAPEGIHPTQRAGNAEAPEYPKPE